MNGLNPESYGAITLADVNLQTGSLTPLHIDYLDAAAELFLAISLDAMNHKFRLVF